MIKVCVIKVKSQGNVGIYVNELLMLNGCESNEGVVVMMKWLLRGKWYWWWVEHYILITFV